MKNTEIDSVELKNEIQQKLQQKYKGKTDEEIEAEIEKRLEDAEGPIAEFWQRMKDKVA